MSDRPVTTTIEALKRLSTFPLAAMLQEIGPLALVQRSSDVPQSSANLYKQFLRTVAIDEKPQVARHALSLILGIDSGIVVPLGRDASEGSYVLGRGVDADIQLIDPSVSSKHAVVRWDAWKRLAWIRDLGSTNGTLINGHGVRDEVQLIESNIVSLGSDTAFLFVKTETLYAMVHQKEQ